MNDTKYIFFSRTYFVTDPEIEMEYELDIPGEFEHCYRVNSTKELLLRLNDESGSFTCSSFLMNNDGTAEYTRLVKVKRDGKSCVLRKVLIFDAYQRCTCHPGN